VAPFVAALSIFGGPSLQASETPQPYSDLLTPTIEKLLRVSSILTTLEQDLEKQKITVEDLEQSLRLAGQSLLASEASLAAVEKRLSDSETLRQELESALASLRTEYEKLRASFLRLSETFVSYKQEAETQLSKVTKSRNVWRGIGIGAVLAAVLAFIAAIV
jgi:chromosome segregation ATPase